MRKGQAGWSEAPTPSHPHRERWLPSSRGENEPQNRRRTDDAFRHHQRAVAAVSVAGTGLLGASLSTQPGTTEFYALTFAVAGTWLTGGLALERPHLGWDRSDEHVFGRLVITPILIGTAAFGVFVGAALVARRIPLLNEAISSILRYPDRGSDRWVLATTLANGAAEEFVLPGRPFQCAQWPQSGLGVDGSLRTCDQCDPQSSVGARLWGDGWPVCCAAPLLGGNRCTDPDPFDLVDADVALPAATIPRLNNRGYSSYTP